MDRRTFDDFVEDAARDIAEGIASPEADRLRQLVQHGLLAEERLGVTVSDDEAGAAVRTLRLVK